MEPGHEDREYWSTGASRAPAKRASMEPGHEDREYLGEGLRIGINDSPQWSPVMKTGNTWGPLISCPRISRLNGARS